MKCIMSVVSGDYFQSYIPLYAMALRTWYKEDIHIFSKGVLTKEQIEVIHSSNDGNIFIHMKSYEDYPSLISTTNALRFIINGCEIIDDFDNMKEYSHCLITDIDLLIFKDPFDWHIDQISATQPFAGHHGPWKKTHRPEICGSWSGNFERVAGGFFCATPEWYKRTKQSRENHSILLRCGAEGKYREADEVILASIIRESGMDIPQSKVFPTELRGLHLGDFKETMNHRWNNQAKMMRILTDGNCRSYQELSRTEQWKNTIKILNDEKLNTILSNVDLYLSRRRF